MLGKRREPWRSQRRWSHLLNTPPRGAQRHPIRSLRCPLASRQVGLNGAEINTETSDGEVTTTLAPPPDSPVADRLKQVSLADTAGQAATPSGMMKGGCGDGGYTREEPARICCSHPRGHMHAFQPAVSAWARVSPTLTTSFSTTPRRWSLLLLLCPKPQQQPCPLSRHQPPVRRTSHDVQGKRSRFWKVKSRAKDPVSGVALLQISDKKQASRAHTRTARVPLPKTSKKVFLRVQDGAGNWSRWNAARIK